MSHFEAWNRGPPRDQVSLASPRVTCDTPAVVRRYLFVAVAVGSLLWAGSGISVLAVALHEHAHHADPHDHHAAVGVALHGHDHEGTPDHDHHLKATPTASRAHAEHPTPVVSPWHGQACDPQRRHPFGRDVSTSGIRAHGPPPYLAHCVLLT